MNTAMNDTATDTAVLVELEWWDRRTGSELVEHTSQALHAADICQPDAIHVYSQSVLNYAPAGDGECSLWISVRTSRTVHDVATVIRAARIRVKSAQLCPAHLITATDTEMHAWENADRAARWANDDR